MQIRELDSVDNATVEAFKRLITQLNPTSSVPQKEDLEAIINSNETFLFVGEKDGEIIGTTSLVFYKIPTGKKAWIEDVVVDNEHLGNGYGKELMQFAIEFARNNGARKLNLTSNPSRIAANAMYVNLGFEVYDTNMYRLDL